MLTDEQEKCISEVVAINNSYAEWEFSLALIGALLRNELFEWLSHSDPDSAEAKIKDEFVKLLIFALTRIHFGRSNSSLSDCIEKQQNAIISQYSTYKR